MKKIANKLKLWAANLKKLFCMLWKLINVCNIEMFFLFLFVIAFALIRLQFVKIIAFEYYDSKQTLSANIAICCSIRSSFTWAHSFHYYYYNIDYYSINQIYMCRSLNQILRSNFRKITFKKTDLYIYYDINRKIK